MVRAAKMITLTHQVENKDENVTAMLALVITSILFQVGRVIDNHYHDSGSVEICSTSVCLW